jgi:hypothetical protein
MPAAYQLMQKATVLSGAHKFPTIRANRIDTRPLSFQKLNMMQIYIQFKVLGAVRLREFLSSEQKLDVKVHGTDHCCFENIPRQHNVKGIIQ